MTPKPERPKWNTLLPKIQGVVIRESRVDEEYQGCTWRDVRHVVIRATDGRLLEVRIPKSAEAAINKSLDHQGFPSHTLAAGDYLVVEASGLIGTYTPPPAYIARIETEREPEVPLIKPPVAHDAVAEKIKKLVDDASRRAFFAGYAASGTKADSDSTVSRSYVQGEYDRYSDLGRVGFLSKAVFDLWYEGEDV
jgi:hypothetical protein